MANTKTLILFFLIGTQLAFHTAEEIQNSTEIIKNTPEINNIDETPRFTQDSYLTALSNSRKVAVKSDRSSVVYVTAANQDGSKITQTVNKPFVAVNKPLVPVNKPLVSVNKALVSVSKPLVSQQAVKNTPVRREGGYPTGPYAEPNNFYNDGHNNNYNGFPNGYDNGYAVSDTYLPQGNYGVPNYHQHHVKPSYGPPTGPYGYGPSASNYVPPIKQDYGIPYGMSSFFDKIKLKLDLFTLGKIILKLIIFKKIVKFIAVICLLLFIPKLIHYKKDDGHDDDDEGQFRYNAEARTDQSINTLWAFVQHAIHTYSQQQRGCEDVGCRMKTVLDRVNEEYSFSSMVDMFNGNEE